eukprot:TRINITY_DN11626_c0_g1_i1.p1 TRINITY_DN11626_c0_g1~~TRINITY_DN11626_c0_g1_i1.p1  ORF type:complete len:151 (+),score=23.05 TRINITY_DN11626_c0_g1_i1:130-582(+)
MTLASLVHTFIVASCSVSNSLMFEADSSIGNRICCNNVRYAEPRGYATDMMEGVKEGDVFYDSVCGIPLFRVNRPVEDWQKEMRDHGWPSFRPHEAIAENINFDGPHGEMSSTCGTHLGHNIPDEKGDRYCINLVCIAGTGPAPEIDDSL